MLLYETHPPLDKRPAILTDDSSKYIFLNKKYIIPIRISLTFVSWNPFDNKPALVPVMAWRRTGDKPFLGLVLTRFIDAYMRNKEEMSYKL